MNERVIRGRRLLVGGEVKPASLRLRGKKIVEVGSYDAPLGGAELTDAGDLLVTPGVIDSHVHINEPGRTEWEGFETATQAAAAGGITTVVDMPLNCIPATVSGDAAKRKHDALGDQLFTNVVFWGGVIPGNANALEGLRNFGVPGCKCFTCPSGVDEFPHVVEADLDQAMPVLRDLDLTLLVHAEAPGPLDRAALAMKGQPPEKYSTYLASRPKSAEDEAIAMVIALARKHGTRVHIVHLSSATAIPLIEQAQRTGVKITAETCLHYLTFTAEEIPDRATGFKCAPPIREASNQAALWDGLRRGVISMVVSDHSPCTPQLKLLEKGDFEKAWGGIASLQLGLSAFFTGCEKQKIPIPWMVQLNTLATAQLTGLADRKGKLAPGYDADLVIWDDKASFTVKAEELRHKHKLTPYAGRTLKGVVKTTLIGGEVAYDAATGLSKPKGELIKRT
ncbi:MAG: allantoinase AllB [Myxococcaceae bacterium]